MRFGNDGNPGLLILPGTGRVTTRRVVEGARLRRSARGLSLPNGTLPHRRAFARQRRTA
jgi:hypothetical protein